MTCISSLSLHLQLLTTERTRWKEGRFLVLSVVNTGLGRKKKKLTLVVLGLHLCDPAKTFSSFEPSGSGHWSMSTFCRSISIPLVPLHKVNSVLKINK